MNKHFIYIKTLRRCIYNMNKLFLDIETLPVENEKQIDHLIYKLYGLTPGLLWVSRREEIAMVEGGK